MAVSAKRKRGVCEDTEPGHVQAVFRRAFEARFTPLVTVPERPQVEPEGIEEEDGEGASDWSGISEDQEMGPRVIEYRDPRHKQEDMDKARRKAFMSSKPPISTAVSATDVALKQREKQRQQQDGTDPSETINLKNDLALQKLLRDSHLLSASSSGTSTPTLSATGSARHKSTDLHLQSLGAKSSVFAQKKMPMAQRKHEVQKARLMEEKRRANAKDAGIVLEKEKRVGRTLMNKKREKGVGGPSIGQFRRGMLSLTNKDVRSIVRADGTGKGKSKRKSRAKSKIIKDRR